MTVDDDLTTIAFRHRKGWVVVVIPARTLRLKSTSNADYALKTVQDVL